MESPKQAQGPITETSYSTSKDGKWIIHKTIITDIKSRAYLDKVLEKKEAVK